METGILQVLSSLLAVATQLAVLAVALAVVRPRNGRAGAFLAGAAGMFLASIVGWGAAVAALPRLLGMSSSRELFGGMSLLHALWSGAAWVLVLLSVLELCRPAAPRTGA